MAARKRVDISEEQYTRCLDARELGETKKNQCQYLGILYNTKRLDTLLQEYLDAREHRTKMRKRMRATPVTDEDVASWALLYLQGSSLLEISESYYRTTGMVRSKLETLGVWGLMTQESVSPLHPPMVNDELMSDEFEVDEVVFVPGYKTVGVVDHSYGLSKSEGVNQYRVYLAGSRERNIFCNAYDLGSLRPLAEAGVDVQRLVAGAFMSKTDVTVLLNECLSKAKAMAAKKD
jgi:hypothetical protein